MYPYCSGGLGNFSKTVHEELQVRTENGCIPFRHPMALCVRHRMAFLLESLQDLDEQLRAKGSRLFVVRGKPEEVLPGLFEEWNVKKLTFEADSEPRSRERDREVSIVVYL